MNHREENYFDFLGSHTRRALLEFLVEEPAVDELERRSILDSCYVYKLSKFVEDKFGNISYTLYWKWIIVPYTDNHYDLGCVLKVPKSLANYALAEITKFYAQVMRAEGCFVAHTNIFILGPPPLQDPSSLASELNLLSI